MGAVGLKLESVYNTLLDVMAHFHAVIDYPDEDIDDFMMQNYLSSLKCAANDLAGMMASFERGSVLRWGIPTVIVGRPNTGKSSLLNALLGYDRAIVTDTPGTTRDTIVEKALIGGVLLQLTDTAGLRKTDDAVERLGVARALDAVASSCLALLVLDGSEPLQGGDFEALRSIPPGTPIIATVNKSDLPCVIGNDELAALGVDHCRVCALTGKGLDALEAGVKRFFPETTVPPSGDIITNARQAEAICRAKDSVCSAIGAIEALVTPDALLAEVEAALSAIGEITGKVMREDITSRVFERFCVGK